MSGGGMPVWLLVPWSSAMTAAVFWQPRWIHRLMQRLVGYTDRLLSRFGLGDR